MNEQNNVTLIQTVYAAFSRGDIQTIVNHLSADVDWNLEGPAVIPFAGRRSGPEQVLQFFQSLGGTQQNQKLTIEAFVAQGDKVATHGRYSATVKATGKRVDCAVAHVFTIRDGKIVQFLDFLDTAQMADAYAVSAAAAH